MADHDRHIPPPAVARNAAKGLDLREKHGHGGTRIGVTRAHQLASRKNVSDDIINRMVSYFARHEVDKAAKNFGNDESPSPGYVAWLLWGGDEGCKWAKDIKDQNKQQN